MKVQVVSNGGGRFYVDGDVEFWVQGVQFKTEEGNRYFIPYTQLMYIKWPE